MKVLNLYAGLGGNRKHWDADVTSVEIEESIAEAYRKNFPHDTLIIGNAHQYLLDHAHEFDFIWSSPPCQTHSKMMKATRHKKPRYSDMSLYQEILFLQHFFKGKWVVENVKPYYEPLIKPQMIGRHCFWANLDLSGIEPPKQPKGFIQNSSVAGAQALKDWLGIQFDGNIYYKDNHDPVQVLRNCVHPGLGLEVFKRATRVLIDPTSEMELV